MRRIAIFFALTVLGASIARAREARAEEERAAPPAEHPPRTLLLEGSVGIGAPLGWAGVGLVLHPPGALDVHVGLGLGSQSPQIAAGLRYRTSVAPSDYLAIGGGWSTGQMAVVGSSFLPQMDYERPATWFWDHAHLVNVDMSLEHETDGRLVFRPFAGLGFIVNGGDAILVNRPCIGGGCGPSLGARIVPYLGVAIAFGVL
jgi:hypothetical protein